MNRWRTILRCVLFVYVIAVVCPIRYWKLEPSDDNTWVSALNYGAAHRVSGLIWSTGPLGYLTFPQDVGDNLARALVFQVALWFVLAVIFGDLFFFSGYKLRNLAAFAMFFGLSAPLYWYNYTGLENLLVAAILVLLVTARWRGGSARYLGALVLTGLVPLLKIPAVIVAGGAVAGYAIDGLYRRRPNAIRDLVLAVTVPAVVAISSFRMLLPSFAAFMQYVRGSLEVAANYSVAMSFQGDLIEFAAVAEIMIWIGVLLYVAAKANRQLASFTVTLLAIPLFLNFKHGFVRQDAHVNIFVCFAAVVLALIALMMSIEARRVGAVMLIFLAYGIIWLEYNVQRFGVTGAISEVAGLTPMRFASHALWYRDARAILKADTEASFAPGSRFEPEILGVVGKSPVASLGIVFNTAILDGLNLQLYPVVKRDGAYSPYLDALNAAWIRDQGPRYLLADWQSIDYRQLWAETPSMWLEIYRWYDTRLLAERHLLLERRSVPRFERLVRTTNFEMRISEGLKIPESETPVFWSLNCHLSGSGSLQKLFFRVPEVSFAVDGGAISRIIPEVLVSPVMGNFLPDNLAELAALMTPSAAHKSPVKELAFGGPGMRAYDPVCQAALWSPQQAVLSPSSSVSGSMKQAHRPAD